MGGPNRVHPCIYASIDDANSKEEGNFSLGGAEAKVRPKRGTEKGQRTIQPSIYELHAPHNGNDFLF